ncbi:glycosyltransferase family 87 protein [Brachyspira murdochii]|uniref:glycosyltransferase family 87 protein n=1 Tax=Brachyspira murdochii TaxID=84378 RepID=UPI0030068420
MNNNNLFFKICLSLLIICFIILYTSAGKERVGYLSNFIFDDNHINRTLQLNGFDIEETKKIFTTDDKLDNNAITNYIFTNEAITNYSYGLKMGYYSKIFKHSDLYMVYPNVNKILENNSFIKEIKMDEGGSPFGNLISEKILEYNEKIDNIIYVLAFKLNIDIILIALGSIILISLFIKYADNKIIKNVPLLFVLLLSFTILLFIIFFIKDKGGRQLNIVLGGWDLFADFYNVLRFIARKDPYFDYVLGQAYQSYLPLSYLLIYPFSIIRNYANMSLYDVQVDPVSNMSLVIFMFIAVLLFILFLKKLYSKKDYNYIIPLLLFITTPVIFTIERANIMFHTAAFVVMFLCLYKSEKKYEQIIALICLGIASALKVYPVLLGFLLLQEKRYKDIVIGASITLGLVFLPFFFFNKHSFLENFVQFISNGKLFSELFPIRDGLALFISKFGISITLSKMILFILFIISIIYSFVANEYWKKVLLLIIISIQTPTTGYYSELFMYPVLILFLIKDKFYKIDYIFLILFVLLLMPFQTSIPVSATLGTFLSGSIWLVVLIETILTRTNILIKNIKIV